LKSRLYEPAAVSDVPTVRAPRPGDLDPLADLWVDLAADQRRHGSHLAAAANRETAREFLAQQVVVDGLLVAEADDDDPVGFVTFAVERGRYDQDRTRGLVHDLYVAPAHRDDGVGSRLLRAAEDALAAAGAETVAVEALAANDAARRLYDRHGYEVHRVEMERPVVRSDTDTSDG
jgi:ribosomal protein S18 acetylase RimI-like enzyme